MKNPGATEAPSPLATQTAQDKLRAEIAQADNVLTKSRKELDARSRGIVPPVKNSQPHEAPAFIQSARAQDKLDLHRKSTASVVTGENPT